MNITKLDIAALRGDILPSKCDFCGELRSFGELEPEEAGAWVCHGCLRRWMSKDVAMIRVILEMFYTKHEAAKWWFTPQSILQMRTPHQLLLVDQTSYVLDRLRHFADGHA